MQKSIALALVLLGTSLQISYGLQCAVFYSEEEVTSVTRVCETDHEMLRAGAGLAPPCIWTCNATENYCRKSSSTITNKHRGDCADMIYSQPGGVCETRRRGSTCVCINAGDISNLGACSSAYVTGFPIFAILVTVIMSLANGHF